MKKFSRSYHVVQVSRDESLVLGDRTDEPFQRQLEYGRILQDLAPGSRMSIMVLLRRGDARPVTVKNVTFIPLVGRIAGRLRLWATLKALHRERPIDVITPQTVFDEAWIVLLFARLSGARVVGQIHYDVFSDVARNELLGTRVLGWIRWKFGIRCLRYFHTLRAVGKRTATQIEEQRLSHNVKVLPVPVGAVRRRKQGGNRGLRRVLFVGRMLRQKNLDDWLQIAAVVARQVPDSSFFVVGDGPLRVRLEARASELGLNGRITFTGYIPNDRLGAVYESATVFLLTSHYEGFGRVLVEAYAYGVPVVAYACAGVEDIVADGATGHLHPQGAREVMAESVIHLLEHPEEARQMGAAGQERVRERFDPDNLARRWIRLLISTVLPPLPHVTMPRRGPCGDG